MTRGVDVVVVGGRIAGSLTALRLADHGMTVRLLESRDLPSHTLSTHFFRGDGLVRSLDEVAVLDEVLATGAPPLTCEYNSVDGAPLEEGPPQEPGRLGFCLSVRRSVLDVILFERARACGVEVRTHTKAVSVDADGATVTGVTDDHGHSHRAPIVVAADGRRSSVARALRAPVEERHPPARAMYYRYVTGWESPDPVGPEFLLNAEDFTYALPSDGGVTCLAVSITAHEHESARRDPAARLTRAFADNPATAIRIDRAEWASRVFTGVPADSVWRQAAGPGWALVGDAGSAQDPWAGLGMDTAARQAESLVEAITTDPHEWQPTYERLRRERTYEDFEATTRLAPDLRQLLDETAQ
jgi:flavin-dependent dehydrogenase